MAWHGMGWRLVAFSEIEPFPSKVLAHHYPDVPNLGDMTKFNEWKLNDSIELLVGGTPCQSFSVAGLRQGLKDPRGNLMLTYLAIADKFKPQWIVWENVPGVLSSNNGQDFAAFLEGLAELGYGWAYRVLDAQHCRTHDYPAAVPQRRRRVFVVGCFGSTERAAKVLFEPESLLGNPAPGRKTGQEVAKCLTRGIGTRFDSETDTFAIAGNIIGRQPENGGHQMGVNESGSSYTLTKTDVNAVAYLPFDTTQITSPANGSNPRYADPCHPLASGAHAPAVAFHVDAQPDEMNFSTETTATLTKSQHAGVAQSMSVRRLTPTECERFQGFPEGYTNIPGASDEPRYKALGNSMAVNVMQLIGERIQKVVAA